MTQTIASKVLSPIVTIAGPWYNPPVFTVTHVRGSIISTWLTSVAPSKWVAPVRGKNRISGKRIRQDGISVRGSKIYYFDKPVACYRKGWILFRRDWKIRATARSVLRHLRISGTGTTKFLLVNSLRASPVAHRAEFIAHVHRLGMKLVRSQKLKRYYHDEEFGTVPHTLEHFEMWWQKLVDYCIEFRLDPPIRDSTLVDGLIAMKVAASLGSTAEDIW